MPPLLLFYVAALCSLIMIILFVNKFDNSDKRKISVLLRIVKPISYYKFVWNIEARIIYLYLRHTALRLIKKRTQTQ